MSEDGLRTVLIGFGRIAHGNTDDPVMSNIMKYASHAQVLAEHSAFSWTSVVEPQEESRRVAMQRWQIEDAVPTVNDLLDRESIEVAVLTTPPLDRIDCLRSLPNLKAVFVEKPLGTSLSESREFVDYCHTRNLIVQVNLTRRADSSTLALANGRLNSLVGPVQLVNGIYGNGVLNNGTHMVDLVRQLFGEIDSVQAIPGPVPFKEGPIHTDSNFPFILLLSSGLRVTMQPVRFSNYRENGLDIWGELGRFEYMHGGLTLLHYPVGPSRVVKDEREIALDTPCTQLSSLGEALYQMYENLAEAIRGANALLSPVESALKTATVIAASIHSSQNGCQLTPISGDWDVPSK